MGLNRICMLEENTKKYTFQSTSIMEVIESQATAVKTTTEEEDAARRGH